MKAVNVPSVIKRRFGIDIEIARLIHVGANTGQELAEYEAAGIEGYHIEAMPAEFEQLRAASRAYPHQHAVQACCDAEAGREVAFYVANSSQSSSLLKLGRHAVAYPRVEETGEIKLDTTTLDRLAGSGAVTADPDLLVLDVQGAEKRVLAGATNLLRAPSLWGIVAEVSLDPLYIGGTTFDELYLDCLKPNGFFLANAHFNRQGWTDALFLKRWWKTADGSAPLRDLASNRPRVPAG